MVTARPTIKDVARAADVSKGAVSFALNDRPGVAPATRARILAVAREMGWSPNARARSLSVSKAFAAGLVIARPAATLGSDPFFATFIAGVEAVLSERGYALLLQMVPRHDREGESYRRLVEGDRVDGVFLTDLLVGDPRPAMLAELGLPAVVVGPGLGEPPWPTVGFDDAPPVRATIQHLIALGHRRIAHVAGPREFVHGRSRRQTWADTLRAGGLPDGQCVEADFSAESGAAATRLLLDDPQPPTAIVYANDVMALAGLSVAAGRGISVPGDLSITGYDDIELAAVTQPPLTTVRQDVVAWGQAAATRLLELIDDETASTVDLPPPQLVVRGSTAAVREGAQPQGTTGRPAVGHS